MQCPNCQLNKIRKNGHRQRKQNYHCQECDRQFIDRYTERGYSTEVKEKRAEKLEVWIRSGWGVDSHPPQFSRIKTVDFEVTISSFNVD